MSADGRVPAAIALQALGAQHLTEACLVRADGVLRLRRQDVHLALSEVEACVVVRIVLRQGCLRFCRQLALKLGGLVGVDHHNLHGPTAQDAPPLIWLDAEACLVHQGLAGLLELLQRTERGGQVILGEDLVVAEEAVVDGVHAGPEERREDHVHLVLDPLALERLVGRAGRTEVVAHADGHGRVDPHGDPLRSALQHGDDPAVLHVSGISQLMNLGALVLRGHWPELTPWDGASEAQSSRQVQTGAEAADAHGLGQAEGRGWGEELHGLAASLALALRRRGAAPREALHHAAADQDAVQRRVGEVRGGVGQSGVVGVEGHTREIRRHLQRHGAVARGLVAVRREQRGAHDEALGAARLGHQEATARVLGVRGDDAPHGRGVAGHEGLQVVEAEGLEEGTADGLHPEHAVGDLVPPQLHSDARGLVHQHGPKGRRRRVQRGQGELPGLRRPAQERPRVHVREGEDGRGPAAPRDGAHEVHLRQEAEAVEGAVLAQRRGHGARAAAADAPGGADGPAGEGLPQAVHGRHSGLHDAHGAEAHPRQVGAVAGHARALASAARRRPAVVVTDHRGQHAGAAGHSTAGRGGTLDAGVAPRAVHPGCS
mmetsp:Transcript_61342/g.148416  ORF Transcript_61342/g.148416 Transcript_61342/m.148416 type:complete len:602 (-) Transcript_61342:412-2217(-)